MTDEAGAPAQAQGFKKDRMASLQDGIFAVALTLLAVDLRIPDGLSHAAVRGRFVELLPAIAVYGATFAMVAVVWLFVYSFQEVVSKQDIPGTSLLLLACSFVVLLPFTSSTFARYPYEPMSVAAFVANVLLDGLDVYRVRRVRVTPAVPGRRWGCSARCGGFSGRGGVRRASHPLHIATGGDAALARDRVHRRVYRAARSPPAVLAGSRCRRARARWPGS